KVERDVPVARGRCVEIATGRVGALPICRITKHKEELMLGVWRHRIQAVVLTTERKCHVAGTCGLFRHTKNIGDHDLLDGVCGDKRCLDAIFYINREPLNPTEALPCRVLRIIYPDAILLAAPNHEQREPVHADRLRGATIVDGYGS